MRLVPLSDGFPRGIRSCHSLPETSSMNGKLINDCFDAVYVALVAHTDEIAQLDRQIGDGDHIYNLIRGLEALRAIRPEIETAEFGEALRLAANKVLSTVGGSSGPLLASLLLGMSRTAPQQCTAAEVATMYVAGLEALQQRCKNGRGRQTLKAVLMPEAWRVSEVVGPGGSVDEDILQ